MAQKSGIRNYMSYISNNDDNDNSGKKNLVLIDELNINIIKELVNDGNIRSAVLARKLRTPLSTIQRRKAALEKSLLKKNYEIEVRELGWRTADIYLQVAQGKSEEIAKKLLVNNNNNNIVLSTALRIGDPEINVSAHVFYKSSQELHTLIENIKAEPYVQSVEWSEIVKVVGINKVGMLEGLFNGI